MSKITLDPKPDAPRLAWNRPRFERKYYSDAGPTLFTSPDQKKPSREDHLAEIYKQALSTIAEHYAKSDYMIADLAKDLNVSVRQLQRVFQQAGSEGFRAEMRKVRIANGKRLLEETELAPQEIARKVGYAHSAHFYQSFEREIGVKPRQYRKQLEEALVEETVAATAK